MDVQTRGNLQQLVRRTLALPGVDAYLFCAGLHRLELVGLERLGSSDLGAGLVRLGGGGGEAAPLVALLPLGWSRALVGEAEAACLPPDWDDPLIPIPPALEELSTASPSLSRLGQAIVAYRCALQAIDGLAGTLAALQQERQLSQQLSPRLVKALGRRQPLEPGLWLSDGLTEEGHTQLAALLQLLPQEEQGPMLQRLVQLLEDRLADRSGDLVGWLGLATALVAAVNSRDPQLLEPADHLRSVAVAATDRLTDGSQQLRCLLQLLTPELLQGQPEALAWLETALTTLLRTIRGLPRRSSCRSRLRQELETALAGAGTNLLLLRRLLLVLEPWSCRVLADLLTPATGRQLLESLLLISDLEATQLDPDRRDSLVMLFERLLARIWWNGDQLEQLLRNLRRFSLEIHWLEAESSMLRSLIALHALGSTEGRSEGVDGLLRGQLLLLARLCQRNDQRESLHRQLERMATAAATMRVWDEGEEAPVLDALVCGRHQRARGLLRLLALRRGVPDLLPAAAGTRDLASSFEATLALWQRQWGPQARPDATLPITLLITTHAPDPERLAQSLRSLALQTARPAQVLVIDDGSPEPAATLVAERCRRLAADLGLALDWRRVPHNIGQYACRNRALTWACQPVLAIQDDDDLSHPLRLERQWQLLQQGALACYTQHVRLSDRDGQPQADGAGNAMIGDGITTLMVRAETVDQLGGFYPVRSRGDVEFRGRLRRRFGPGSIGRVEAPLYLMRGSDSTVSSQFEYGCSLRLPCWRRLMRSGLLP